MERPQLPGEATPSCRVTSPAFRHLSERRGKADEVSALEIGFFFDAVGRNLDNTGGFYIVVVGEMGDATNEIIRA